MAKYKQRPIVIDAEQFVVWDIKKCPAFIDIHSIRFPIYKMGATDEPYIVIPKKDGNLICRNLDWVIKKGEEFSTCGQDVFENMYEKVN